jgi:quinol monooxygenase YgiN
MEQLKIALWVKTTKLLEFKQTLDHLREELLKDCSNLKITETNNLQSYTILGVWETEEQMQRSFKSKEFTILSGAITALCEKCTIHLNDKLIGSHISMLANLKNKSL